MMISPSLVMLTCSFAAPQDAGVQQEALRSTLESLTSGEFGGRVLGEASGEKTLDYLTDALAGMGLKPGGDRDESGARGFRQDFVLQRYRHMLEPKLILTKRDGAEEVLAHGTDFTVKVHGLMQGTQKLEVFRISKTGQPADVASATRALLFELPSSARKRELRDKGLLEPESWGLELVLREKSKSSYFIGRPAVRFDPKPPGPERFDVVTLLGEVASNMNWRGYGHVQLVADERCEEVTLSNLVAVLPGSNPALKGESVLVQAFYDHVAARPSETGQVDRGTQAAGALAVVLQALELLVAGPPPERSLVVLFSAGGGNKALGVSNYLKSPARSLAQTVAALAVQRPGVGAGGGSAVGLTRFKASKLADACAQAGLIVVADTPNKPSLGQVSNILSKRGVPAQCLGASSSKPGELAAENFLPMDYGQLQRSTEVLLGALRIVTSADYGLEPRKGGTQSKRKR